VRRRNSKLIEAIRSDIELGINWGAMCTPVELLAKDGKKRKENYPRSNQTTKRIYYSKKSADAKSSIIFYIIK